MEQTLTLNNAREIRIARLISKLEQRQQEVLENELETYILLSKASELDKSVKKNEITMSEIVEEVKKARNEN
ncbi:MAG: hypothetical protein II575_02760 [Bacteroidales bacterium]|jgi:hypothetical protein|nr:hypothetical protein [Bacteroidales bacterium]MBQ2573117.1 hypothetical protein [Bacteroidales bacterium]MBR6068639.1 hypothetical protein [Bacteroidales bacterium]